METGTLSNEIQRCLAAFAEFEPEEYVGKGGNGEVMLGVHRGIGRRVALKVHYSTSEAPFDEPKRLCQVNNPNILHVYDARALASDLVYFCTEVAEDGDLEDWIPKRPRGLHEGIDILMGVLNGVAALHAVRLLHRDLKPANIPMHDGRPLIADFGSVRALPEAGGSVPASKHTILYRPPEAFDPGEFTVRSDLYQVGVVGFQLFGGSLSYDGMTYLSDKERVAFDKATDVWERSTLVDGAIRRRAQGGRLVDWATLLATAPRALLTALRRATAVTPTDRFASAADFMAALLDIRAKSANWTAHEDRFELLNYRKRDYCIQIDAAGTCRATLKRKAGAPSWRADPSQHAASVSDVLKKLKGAYEIPR